MSTVELGFLEECLPWQVESRLFPSKVGGKPAWLDLQNILDWKELQCSTCLKQTIFLCQIYAPLEDDEDNFHRTLFVFVCRNAECCQLNGSESFKVFRSNLRRVNQFYSEDFPEEKPDANFNSEKWVSFCKLCGCKAEKNCSKCKNATYCTREHQVIHWKESHKKVCGETEKELVKNSSILFPEWEIVIEPEKYVEKKSDVKEELLKYNDLKENDKIGTLANIPEEELNTYVDCNEDKEFLKFRERISCEPDQVIRYGRNGSPLYIAKEPRPEEIPVCEYCNGPRQFEFQIMPQMLSILKENDLDWGVLLVFTCKKSCGDVGYKKEFIFKQDVAQK